MVSDLAYVECAGVRVPMDSTVEDLRDALGKRKVRFGNEKEILEAFGSLVEARGILQTEISGLVRRKANLERTVTRLKGKLQCPKCGTIYGK